MDFSALIGNSSDTLILTSILKNLDEAFNSNTLTNALEGSESNGGKYLLLVRRILKALGMSIGTLVVLYAVRNIDKFADLAKNFLIGVFYKIIVIKKPHSILLERFKTADLSILGVPIYILNESSSMITLKQIPLFHQSLIKQIQEEALEEIAELSKKKPEPLIQILGTNEFYTPDTGIFPSKNDRMLNDVLDKHFRRVVCDKSRRVICISINGRSGLGKSRSCDYIALMDLYDHIFYINLDLPVNLTKNFKKIIDDILSVKVVGRTVIFVDEIDKFVAKNLQKEYASYIRLKKKDVVAVTQKEFAIGFRSSILNELIAVFDTKKFPNGLALVLPTNNIDTMFKDVDMAHYGSLKDRFTNIIFDPVDKEELIEYIKYSNNLCRSDPILYIEPATLLPHFELIRPDLKVTFRAIHQCRERARDDPQIMIEYINDTLSSFTTKEEEEYEPKQLAFFTREHDTKGTYDEIGKAVRYLSDMDVINFEKMLDRVGVDAISGGKPLLSHCCTYTGNIPMMNILLDRGADANFADSSGRPPLFYVSGDDINEKVTLLIKYGADPDFEFEGKDFIQNTPTLYTKLRDYQYDVNKPNSEGKTFIFYMHKTDKFRQIIDKITDINHQDNEGNTALHYVAASQANFTKFIVENGADPHIKNHKEKTAYEIADATIKKIYDDYKKPL